MTHLRVVSNSEEASDAEGSGNDSSEIADRNIAQFALLSAIAERGVPVPHLVGTAELTELEERLTARLAALFDEVAERWKEQHGSLSELEKIERELRERVRGERDTLDSQFQCEGCGHRHWSDDFFLEFHDLLLCDGCADHARDILRELRQPLVEALEAEPTLENAKTLGFELVRGDDGGLVWVSDDDEYDGGSHPYTDEQDALESLVDELA